MSDPRRLIPTAGGLSGTGGARTLAATCASSPLLFVLLFALLLAASVPARLFGPRAKTFR